MITCPSSKQLGLVYIYQRELEIMQQETKNGEFTPHTPMASVTINL